MKTQFKKSTTNFGCYTKEMVDRHLPNDDFTLWDILDADVHFEDKLCFLLLNEVISPYDRLAFMSDLQTAKDPNKSLKRIVKQLYYMRSKTINERVVYISFIVILIGLVLFWQGILGTWLFLPLCVAGVLFTIAINNLSKGDQ